MSKSTISTFELFQMFPDAEAARVYVEGKRWPDGAVCPDLLAALIDAAAMLDAIARGQRNWDGSTEGQARSTAKDARAAIAKATGQ